MSSAKVEETMNRINTHMGVIGVIIVNSKGLAIRSTMSSNATIENGQVISGFLNGAIAKIQQIHEEETITFIRIRSLKHEIMIAPDKEFALIVIQNPDQGTHWLVNNGKLEKYKNKNEKYKYAKQTRNYSFKFKKQHR